MKARLGIAARALALMLLVTATAACASTAEGGEGSTVVVVQNDLMPSYALSIYAVPDVGSRRLVGHVDPRETATLRFNPFGTGQYRFVAETTAGNEIVSNPISFSPGATLRWDLNANIIRVTDSG